MGKKVINTIREQVYDIIKNEICNGEYQPGQWMQEKELAEKFSVSRSPVREALHQLVFDGLLVEIPNKGIFVREFSSKDMEEIFRMRVLLENYAIEQLQTTLDDSGAAQLQEALTELEAAYQAKNISAYVKRDSQMHRLLIQLSHDNLLMTVYDRVYVLFQQFPLHGGLSEERVSNSTKEHHDMIKCIIDKNTKKAQEINEQHLLFTKTLILKQLSGEA